MTEQFQGYILRSHCQKLPNGRYSVGVTVGKQDNGMNLSERYEDLRLSFILEIEAEQEALSLGRRLIKNRLIGF